MVSQADGIDGNIYMYMEIDMENTEIMCCSLTKVTKVSDVEVGMGGGGGGKPYLDPGSLMLWPK